MKLLVGLGNPEPEHAGQRHNFGFMALDQIHAVTAATPWQKKFHGMMAICSLNGQKLILFKPQNFMNLSGPPVLAMAQFYKINAADILVFHDELELPLGKIRIKQGGGHAGHNGLKSIDMALGPDYWRIRLGIGRPLHPDHAVHDYVLQNFAKEERLLAQKLCTIMAANLECLLNDNPAQFMNKVVLGMKPDID
jgi:peptidyl-tRNA hydrolase, PTH1 family